MRFGQRFSVDLGCKHIPHTVDHDAYTNALRALSKSVRHRHGEVIVVEDIGTDVDAVAGVLDTLHEAPEVL